VSSRSNPSTLAVEAFLALGWKRLGDVLVYGDRTPFELAQLEGHRTVEELALFLWTYGYEEEAQLLLASHRAVVATRS